MVHRGPQLDGAVTVRTGKHYNLPIDAEWAEHACCPLCLSKWPTMPELYVSLEHGIAIADGRKLSLPQQQLRFLYALVAAEGRFIPSEEIVAAAYFDRPECDQPSLRVVTVALTYLRASIKKTRYRIQSKVGYGYRITTRDAMEAEAINDKEQRKREAMAWNVITNKEAYRAQQKGEAITFEPRNEIALRRRAHKAGKSKKTNLTIAALSLKSSRALDS